MTKIQKSKPYALEERTFQFAKAVSLIVKSLPKTITNIEEGKQLIKASGSVGANYREAKFEIPLFSSLNIGIWCLGFGIYLVGSLNWNQVV